MFFAVDYDPTGDSISGPVTDYFTGINASMDAQLLGKYKVGVYGTRNVCSTMIALSKAQATFVAGMSTGCSGNMGFPMPNPWQYNQIEETTGTFAGVNFAVEHDAVSANAEAINLSSVMHRPPRRMEGTARPVSTSSINGPSARRPNPNAPSAQATPSLPPSPIT